MESDNIATLKAKIERLKITNALMADALMLTQRHFRVWKFIETSLEDNRPSAYAKIIDAALSAQSAGETLETSLDTLCSAQLIGKPAVGV